jgi:hypothetical protein
MPMRASWRPPAMSDHRWKSSWLRSVELRTNEPVTARRSVTRRTSVPMAAATVTVDRLKSRRSWSRTWSRRLLASTVEAAAPMVRMPTTRRTAIRRFRFTWGTSTESGEVLEQIWRVLSALTGDVRNRMARTSGSCAKLSDPHGGRSSARLERQVVALEVGGSSPLGHPITTPTGPGSGPAPPGYHRHLRASSSMAEQRTLNPQVLGSNPRGRTFSHACDQVIRQWSRGERCIGSVRSAYPGRDTPGDTPARYTAAVSCGLRSTTARAIESSFSSRLPGRQASEQEDVHGIARGAIRSPGRPIG